MLCVKTVLYFTVQCCTILYFSVLYCTVLYCSVLYYTVLHCTVLYCTVLYCIVLYCTAPYCITQVNMDEIIMWCGDHMEEAEVPMVFKLVQYINVLYCTKSPVTLP